MEFRIKNPSTQVDAVEFEASIDSDGDFLVKANGEDLFYVDKSSGKLVLFWSNLGKREKVPGLSFNHDGFLVVD